MIRDTRTSTTPPASGGSAAWGIAASVLVVAALVGVLLLFDLDKQIVPLLNRLQGMGAWAPFLFVVLMAGAVLFLLPGVPFTAGAGFVFGVGKGTLCVVLGTTLGATLAFLIARHLFGERARRAILAHPRLHRINRELAPQGWKVVLITRLVPFFPFKLSNYFFGLTSIRLRSFVGGTLLGIIPFSLNSVYLGSIAADLTTLGAGGRERTPLEWGLYGAGFLVAVGVLLYLNRMARRAMATTSVEDDTESDAKEPDRRG
ncbi:MAG: TVP38/TMEM64 family protein [Nitrospirota bacterium]|nr:TVP38/TMEM64 family protein [Nitrospirota bacterium]